MAIRIWWLPVPGADTGNTGKVYVVGGTSSGSPANDQIDDFGTWIADATINSGDGSIDTTDAIAIYDINGDGEDDLLYRRYG